MYTTEMYATFLKGSYIDSFIDSLIDSWGSMGGILEIAKRATATRSFHGCPAPVLQYMGAHHRKKGG
jgi:hypothetical protein